MCLTWGRVSRWCRPRAAGLGSSWPGVRQPAQLPVQGPNGRSRGLYRLRHTGSASVVIIRTVVVLPSPLGPSSPSTMPRGTAKLTPPTGTLRPNLLTRSIASTAGPETGMPSTVSRREGMQYVELTSSRVGVGFSGDGTLVCRPHCSVAALRTPCGYHGRAGECGLSDRFGALGPRGAPDHPIGKRIHDAGGAVGTRVRDRSSGGSALGLASVLAPGGTIGGDMRVFGGPAGQHAQGMSRR